MKYLLYDIILHLFTAISIPYFLIKMLTAKKYRTGILERFGFIRKVKLAGLEGGPVVWVHAVSVGETKAVVPLLKLFRERHPEAKVVFSTVTRTGNRTAEADCSGLIDSLIYFPLDFSWTVKRVLKRLKPRVFITVEKEIWPNLFRSLERGSVPIIVVNGTISERSFRRFKTLGFFFREVFGRISYFCGRTGEDCERAVLAGARKDRVANTGNLKFDLKPPLVDSAYLLSLKSALDIRPENTFFVAGSTHRGEEEIVLEAFKAVRDGFPGLKLVLAPRHPERFDEVEELIKKTGLALSRRTSGKEGGKEAGGGGAEVILLDTVGELMMVYSFSSVALVGGSLVPGIGGHNLLEPAFFGKPVLYGGHLTTYLNMAEMLEEAGGGVRVWGAGDLAESLKNLLSSEEARARAGQGAKAVVEANRGSAKRTIEIIEGFLPERVRGRRPSNVVKLRK